MTKQLEGKVAIITGAGTGLGAASARALAAEGCKLILVGRRVEPIEAMAKELSGLAISADVSSEEDVKALVETCEKHYGRLDILVNSAGASGGGLADAEDIDIDIWDQTFDINVKGVMLCIKHALRLIKRNGGSIVNIASVAGLRAMPRQIPYSASKAAVLSMSRVIAQEVGAYGVRVNCVCPGTVDTDLFRANAVHRLPASGGSIDDVAKNIAADLALSRLTTAEEIASAVLFLASDKSSAMTGTQLTVDAGKIFC